ncbi:hypothetical protein GGR50DRAFT_697966 [Xylaria sp. CBS 124048]|nr:hypothetical protein GGR50DRAFT_697966 [Xylaria sp. CBS 124048]
MAPGVVSRLKTYVRQKLSARKANRSRSRDIPPYASAKQSTTEADEGEHTTSSATSNTAESERSKTTTSTTSTPNFNDQQTSPFFQTLPLEVRKMIYAYIWRGPHDHRYHESSGRHLHFQDGRWLHTRCVMYREDDEDLDLIQTNMDTIQRQADEAVGHPGVHGDAALLMWQRRLASTCGRRHWRCGERMEFSLPSSIDRTDLGALMMMIFTDLYSAHRFMVQYPSSASLLRHMRRLDLTLSLPHYALADYDYDYDYDYADHDHDPTGNSIPPPSTGYLDALLAALAENTTCLHSLRISLDIYDRGPWRKLPERALAPALKRIHVRKGRKGQTNYTVELPATLPVRTEDACMQHLQGDGGSDGMPFHVVRRSPLRYWQFHPGEVEQFAWESCPDVEARRHCHVAPSKGDAA